MHHQLKELRALSGVEGILVCDNEGNLHHRDFPQQFSSHHLEEIVDHIRKSRSALTTTAGEMESVDFRYQDHRLLVFYLNFCQIIVLGDQQIRRQEVESCINTCSGPVSAKIINLIKAPPANQIDITNPSLGKNLIILALVLLLCGIAMAWVLLPNSFNPLAPSATEGPAEQHEPATKAIMMPAPEIDAVGATVSKRATLLTLHGSNTIGAKLAPALTKAWLQQMGALDIAVHSGNIADESSITATMANGEPVVIEIAAHGSSTSFKSLNKDICDIGMASRPIKDKEVLMLERYGDMRAASNEHVLAMDGIAVIVNPANTLRELPAETLKALFAGTIRDWKDIPESGLQGPVKIYARDEKSGTWDTFKKLVLRGETLTPASERLEDSRKLTTEVASDPNAIGFIGLPYIKPSKAIAVSEPGTRAVYPNSFTVSTEDYPLARKLFLYTASVPQNPHARPFVEFALSAEGQKIAREIGFVELTISEEQMKLSPEATRKYRAATSRANRLSLNFRFRHNSTELDTRGLRDIERLVSFLSTPENRNRSISLLGFSDSVGDNEVNHAISLSRAHRVEEILLQHGIKAGRVLGFGESMPVADNSTQAGKQKNRRVEVWLEKG